jgi:predicted ATP-dependent endonuclease of OLD family
MRYQQFKIKNFKGISELEINLAKIPISKVYPFVGLNESGKTTILEALDWFKNPEDYDKHDLIPKNLKANFNDIVSVSAKIELEKEDLESLYKFIRKKKIKLNHELENVFTYTRNYNFVNSNFEDSYSTVGYKLFGRYGNQKIDGNLSERSNESWQEVVAFLKIRMPPIVYYKDLYFDFPDKIYLTEGTTKDYKEEIYREMIQDVLDSLNRSLSIEEHLIKRAEKVTRTNNENIEAVLNLVSDQITNILKDTWGDIFKTKDNNLEISVGDNIQIEEVTNRLFITIKVKEGISKYLIKERSLGFRWFLAFVLFTHFRAYREHQKNGLFLLDEPASNLHSTAQSKLLKEFNTFPNNQIVIFSTHSHHMINPQWLPTTFVVINNGMNYKNLNFDYKASDTKINAMIYHKFVDEYPKDSDYYRPILDALDYSPSDLEYVRDILFVEGKNDFHTLHYLSFLLGEKLDFGIAPFTGKDKIEMMVSFYLGWGKNFLVLLDDDRGGKQTRTKILSDFGQLMEKKVFTLRNVNTKFRSFDMESLFTNEDRVKIIKENFPNQEFFDKYKFNTSLIELSYANKKINLSDVTKENFRILIKFLNEKFYLNKQKKKIQFQRYRNKKTIILL